MTLFELFQLYMKATVEICRSFNCYCCIFYRETGCARTSMTYTDFLADIINYPRIYDFMKKSFSRVLDGYVVEME